MKFVARGEKADLHLFKNSYLVNTERCKEIYFRRMEQRTLRHANVTAPDLFSFSADIVIGPYFRRESNFFIVGLHNFLFDDGVRSFWYFSAGHNTNTFT